MSSASRGSGTRRRMKLRSRDCSRLTTSEIRWSCSVIDRGLLSAWATYICRRRKERNISGFPPQKGIQEPGFGSPFEGANLKYFSLSRSEEHTSELQSRGHLV